MPFVSSDRRKAYAREASRKFQAERYNRLRSAGFCVGCAVEDVRGSGYVRCRRCRIASAAIRERRLAAKRGTCRGCGGPTSHVNVSGLCSRCFAAKVASPASAARHRARPVQACACGKPLSRQNTSGLCVSCNARKQAQAINQTVRSAER